MPEPVYDGTAPAEVHVSGPGRMGGVTILRGSPEPVEVMIERDHRFKSRGKAEGSKRTLPGCAVCKRGKLNRAHLGAPPSMNGGNHSMDPMAYQALKHAWQAAIHDALLELGDRLPRPCESVTVEALIGFDTYASRDQGNLRWMVEKATGDALVEGGWLPDDTFWPVRRYVFGGLEGEHTPGRSFTRLLLFPSVERAAVCPRFGEQVPLL
jgi:hypothetical protein